MPGISNIEWTEQDRDDWRRRYEELEHARCMSYDVGPSRSLAFAMSAEKLEAFAEMTDVERLAELGHAEALHAEYLAQSTSA